MRSLAALILGIFLAACATEPPPYGGPSGPVRGPDGALYSQTGGICGGIGGFRCANPNDYCAMEANQCRQIADAAGICTPKAEACPMIYQPVCGCDGQTYSNGCVASSSGVSVARNGEC